MAGQEIQKKTKKTSQDLGFYTNRPTATLGRV